MRNLEVNKKDVKIESNKKDEEEMFMLSYFKEFRRDENWVYWLLTMVPSLLLGFVIGGTINYVEETIFTSVIGVVGSVFLIYEFKLRHGLYFGKEKPKLFEGIMSLSWKRDLILILVFTVLSYLLGMVIGMITGFLAIFAGIGFTLSIAMLESLSIINLITLVLGVFVGMVIVGILTIYLLMPYYARNIVAGLDTGEEVVRTRDEIKQIVSERLGKDQKITIIKKATSLLIFTLGVFALAVLVTILLIINASAIGGVILGMIIIVGLYVYLAPFINYAQYRMVVDEMNLKDLWNVKE